MTTAKELIFEEEAKRKPSARVSNSSLMSSVLPLGRKAATSASKLAGALQRSPTTATASSKTSSSKTSTLTGAHRWPKKPLRK